MAKTTSNDDNENVWAQRFKVTFGSLAAIGIGFLIGMFIVSPFLSSASPGHIPKSVLKMPTGYVRFSTGQNQASGLVVRIANTYDAREQGLQKVGEEALETTFLLYDQNETTTWGEDYNVKNIRSTLTMVVMTADGKILSIKNASPSEAEVSVDKDHRYVLAVKKGILKEIGITTDSKMTKVTTFKEAE